MTADQAAPARVALLSVGDELLLTLVEQDLRPGSKETLAQVTERARLQIEARRRGTRPGRGKPSLPLRGGAAQVGGALLVLRKGLFGELGQCGVFADRARGL